MFPEKRPSARFSHSNQSYYDIQPRTSLSQNIAFLSTNQNKCKQGNAWIIDSGATQHMCNDRSKFINFKSSTTSITIANNTKMKVVGRGDVRVKTKTGSTFTLLDVLYVPQLASNLLSVTYAIKNPNIRFDITSGLCRIMFKNNVVASAQSHSSRSSLLILETTQN